MKVCCTLTSTVPSCCFGSLQPRLIVAYRPIFTTVTPVPQAEWIKK
jgi:hypothetical protein